MNIERLIALPAVRPDDCSHVSHQGPSITRDVSTYAPRRSSARPAVSYNADALDLAAEPDFQTRHYLSARRLGAGESLFGFSQRLPVELQNVIVRKTLELEHRDGRDGFSRDHSLLILKNLLLHLPPGARSAAHADLRNRASAIVDEEARAGMFGPLAEHLPPGDEAAAHADLRERAALIVNEEARLDAFAPLAEHLPPGSESAVHTELREFSSAVHDETLCAIALGFLAAHLPRGHEATAHADLRDRTAAIVGEEARLLAIIHFAHFLPPADAAAAPGSLRKRASAILDNGAQAIALLQIEARLP